MFDIKWVRQNALLFDRAMQKRGVSVTSESLLAEDEALRVILAETEALRAQRNSVAQRIGQISQTGTQEDVETKRALVAEGKKLRAALEQKELALSKRQKGLQEKLSSLPNRPLDDVPLGVDETGNVCIREVGDRPTFSFEPRAHEDIGAPFGLSMAQGAALSGARFVVLKGQMAKLERALANFMLDLHSQKFGYEEISPPYLVRADALYGVGQLPKFSEEAFQTTDGRWLISTSEVSLVNLAAKKTWKGDELPLNYMAYTPCFRSEAGAAGRDTRGLIRLHQFSKVELVSVVPPGQGARAHEAMLSHSEEVLKQLDLPYRVMLLCAGDMGFAAQKTYDLEVWLPAQKKYREIASCSFCGDFQARRMGARFKAEDGKSDFVHTLNGSGLPIGRTLAALLENGQQKDGSVKLPAVLERYVNSLDLRVI